MSTRTAPRGRSLPAWLVLLAAAALAPAAPRAAEGQTRGPSISVPECRISNEGCALDVQAPDMDPAGCAMSIVRLLERRQVATALPGAVADVCAADPRALVLEASVTATCPVIQGNDTPRDFALRTRLRGQLALRDCVSGEVVGRGEAIASVENGRQALLRDAVEHLARDLAGRKVRRTHPETPFLWFRADPGGWKSVEITAGGVDSESSGMSDFLADSGIDRVDIVPRVAIDYTYTPSRSPRLHVAAGFEMFEFSATEKGSFDGADFYLDPNKTFASTQIDVRLRVLGTRLRVGYGFNLTRNQKISAQGSVGYYFLGPDILDAWIRVDGLADDAFDIRDSDWGSAADVRWEWRPVTHLVVSVTAGWSFLNYGEPNRENRARFFPYDADFSGASALVGIAGRW